MFLCLSFTSIFESKLCARRWVRSRNKIKANLLKIKCNGGKMTTRLRDSIVQRLEGCAQWKPWESGRRMDPQKQWQHERPQLDFVVVSLRSLQSKHRHVRSSEQEDQNSTGSTREMKPDTTGLHVGCIHSFHVYPSWERDWVSSLLSVRIYSQAAIYIYTVQFS